jgi:hypothetical protein
MTQETLPLGVYAIPRDGGDGDVDVVEYSVDTPVTVSQQGTAEYKVTVNWPTGLAGVKVSIRLPSEATMGAGSISPSQTGQSITPQGAYCDFEHPNAAFGDTITYSLPFTVDSAATGAIRYKLEADELEGPVSRAESVVFV